MIKWIIITLIGLIILGYLGFDVRSAVESPTSQSNISYVKNVVIYVLGQIFGKTSKISLE